MQMAVAASVAFLVTAKVANVQVPMIFKMAIGTDGLVEHIDQKTSPPPGAPFTPPH